MCRHCGAEMTKHEDWQLENRNSSKVDASGTKLSCKSCGEIPDIEFLKNSSMKSVLSPMPSLPSSDCSDYSIEMNPGDSFEFVRNLEDLSYRLDMLSQKPSREYIRIGSERSNALTERDNGNDMYKVRDIEIMQPNDGDEAIHKNSRHSLNNETESSSPICGVMDAAIWEPPGPEEPDDDMEENLNNDDDEEASVVCNHDNNIGECGKSVSLSFKERTASFKLREEKLRAMEEVYNGRFKSIVHQLFQSFGVASSAKDDDNWVDIVASLSWEAALFLKPDTSDGKAMDPDGCVKVKCVAVGSHSQSKFIKGLVFKKHASHKHMPTKFTNPKLLLIQGVLGPSSSGLLSLNTMDQEKEQEKSIIEMIELCQPDVILVEKTVSRGIQESILGKGRTLVLEMKLHRLERIARCLGSPILSSDSMMNQKLKCCDALYFEKYVEEHVTFGEEGKRASKTLLFIEGCPTRRGGTILLKGSHSDELKRIKCVVRCAVVIAHHLILETSFLVDQSAMFTTIPFVGLSKFVPLNKQFPDFVRSSSQLEEPANISLQSTVDIPISTEFQGGSEESNLELEGDLGISHEPYTPLIFSGFSSLSESLKKVIGDIPFTSSYSSLSSYLGFHGDRPDGEVNETISIPIMTETDHGYNENKVTLDHGYNESKGTVDEENLVEDVKPQSIPAFSESPAELEEAHGYAEEHTKREDNVHPISNSQSILVLMSSRNAMRGVVCEQSHFSHIMFYKNFDVPLGKFLGENLLNQNTKCNSCGEPPGAHFYYYAHNNKQLTIQVRQISGGKFLPGKKEGKLWMWSRCGYCKLEKGTSNYSKRVLISPDARCLSFGKFLELSFFHYSSSSKLSSCGHSLYRDFLHFFGFGPMVAMFKYSQVPTYTVSVPPQKLEYGKLVGQEKVIKATQNVYTKGMQLFTEVTNTLKKIRSQLKSPTLNLQGSLKDFSVVEEMLKRDRFDFEVNIHNTLTDNGNADPVYKFLLINRLLWELLLESCIWDRRLYSLLSPNSPIYCELAEKVMPEPIRVTEGTEQCDEIVSHNSLQSAIQPEKSLGSNEFLGKESIVEVVVPIDSNSLPDNSSQKNYDILFEQVPSSVCDHSNVYDASKGAALNKSSSKLGVSKDWYWTPFSEIRQVHMKEITRNYIPKFEVVSSDTAKYLPSGYQLIMQEGSRLHIPLGTDDHIVSDYEGELSSIVACVLAMLNELPVQTEIPDQENLELRASAKSFDNLRSLNRFPSGGSSESDSIHSTEGLRFFSFDGLNLLDSIVPETFRPAEPEGVVRSLAKGKYIVNCPYFMQFLDLRSRCLPSELHYIASLSRCRDWEAQGGKSKSFFAKTLDDRFIIKEIKKTEYDSFMKIAPDYFEYMNQSFELGNQTCLAKVLGIYQVMVRHTKSGKETRHDLMVMENLTFGRKISRQYDLKGALHARYNSVASDVLLDQNFVNDMNSSPLYVSNQAKRILQRAVWNDTTFLNSINVMDYSLLVGVDSERRELVCGIIDYLRQYTWDKHLETWVKSSLVPRNVLPTVISPKEYKRRFRKFMSTNFFSVPDRWCMQRSEFDDPCELCGDGEEKVSN